MSEKFDKKTTAMNAALAKIKMQHPHAKKVTIAASESDDGTVLVTAQVDGKDFDLNA